MCNSRNKMVDIYAVSVMQTITGSKQIICSREYGVTIGGVTNNLLIIGLKITSAIFDTCFKFSRGCHQLQDLPFVV